MYVIYGNSLCLFLSPARARSLSLSQALLVPIVRMLFVVGTYVIMGGYAENPMMGSSFAIAAINGQVTHRFSEESVTIQ